MEDYTLCIVAYVHMIWVQVETATVLTPDIIIIIIFDPQ